MSDPAINIRDVGPIQSVTIPVPADGGVVVLRGRNGAGKTIALSAVDALTRENGGTPKARAREGSLGGTVEGLGRTIKISAARSTTRGELAVTALGDEIDVAALVDPGLKDVAAADRARIRAAIGLAGARCGIEAFGDLVGGVETLRTLVSPNATRTTDPVDMADAVRRDLNALALDHEKKASVAETSAAGLRQAAGDHGEMIDENAVRAEAEEATAAKRELEQRAKLAKEGAEKRAAAQKALDEAGGAPDVEAAEDEFNEALAAHAEAEKSLHFADATLRDARSALDSARKTAARIAIAKVAIESASITAPTEAELVAASERLRKAHEATARIGQQRQAQAQRDEAAKATLAAAQHTVDAQALREAARGVDDVLASVLADSMPESLRIIDGRLVVADDNRKRFFADLSEGERWRIALDMAISALGESRILAISQVAWEGLDGEARAEIHAHAKAQKTVIVTAEADHGEVGALRAEVLT
jgi:hypothetical protein